MQSSQRQLAEMDAKQPGSELSADDFSLGTRTKMYLAMECSSGRLSICSSL